jgi:hypothetical protein
MVVAIVIVVAAIIVIACVFGSKVSAINNKVDDLFHKLLTQEGEITQSTHRLDAHFKDIVSNQKRIDEVDANLYALSSKMSINNAYSKEKRGSAENVIIAKYGEQSLRSIAKELGISATTINRWAKALKAEGKLQ